MKTTKWLNKLLMLQLFVVFIFLFVSQTGFTQNKNIKAKQTSKNLVMNNIKYPSSQPEILEGSNELTLLFPQQVGVVLNRQPGQSISGINKLLIGKNEILSQTPELLIPSASLEIVRDTPVGGITDWQSYLVTRAGNNKEWPKIGGREIHHVSLDSSKFLGYRIESDSIFITSRVNFFDISGELEWCFCPVNVNLGGTDYFGLGWKLTIHGLEQAAWLNIIEAAAPHFGDWAFAQTWGNFIESQVGAAPFDVPKSYYFGDTQPFYFSAGQSGIEVSFFENPVCAEVEIVQDGDFHLIKSRIPLGQGSIRETPIKMWLWSEKSCLSKWTAIDEWTYTFDALSEHYRDVLGLKKTELVPVLEMPFPDENYIANYQNFGKPQLEESWFYKFSQTKLEEAAELGFRLIRVVPWESDAEYSFDKYLPGSECFGSGNAPWHLEVSEALGGEIALKELNTKANELSIKIVLWTSPGHLSNSSPLLVQHPEWIMWRHDGTPETADYGDVTGVSLYSGYYDYSLSQFGSVKMNTGINGFMVDSHLTFGIMTDYRQIQPTPQLDLTYALQQEWWNMGCTDIIIEGCGPLGLSSGGFPGYDAFEPEMPPEIREEAQRRLDRIIGREYGLYRYIVDTVVEPAGYYRALASKGHISPQYLDVLKRKTDEEISLIARANFDYLQVMDRMEKRHLIGKGDSWSGVYWTNQQSSEIVLFVFEQFNYPLNRAVLVKDITTGKSINAGGHFKTAPMHTYVIGETISEVDKQPQQKFELLRNYPNPFNAETVISYQLKKPGNIYLSIYNILGQRVRTLLNKKQTTNSYKIKWDGLNDFGVPVSSGVYYFKMKVDRDVDIKKMLLLR